MVAVYGMVTELQGAITQRLEIVHEHVSCTDDGAM